uniref:NADH-ubiquinone oxidoreductase chain 3 n=1 Tax=Ophiomastix mixta TaxID=2705303 RepID=A0A6C0FD04_9ECHI|nr:NADH dehydrogenase subunit 3 [Ophiomastix mixta]QHT54188.1 NADH dehydrogenase subunit 3 [Ophiomastix mixta]
MTLQTYIYTTILLTTLMWTIGQILPPHKPDLAKVSPYECGFEPMTSSRLPFSFRFFMVAILFLIFDLEIALLIPLPSSLLLTNTEGTLIPLLIFLLILIIGLIYEWVNGGLEWAE